MMPMAMMTAIIMMARWSTMPTAVMTESSENTASSTTICVTMTQKLAYARPRRRAVAAALEPLVQLHGALEQQEEAARHQDQVASGRRQGPMENSGVVSVTSQDMTDNRPRRMTSARLSPRMRARSRCEGQLVRQDGDENQVINAQDDLKNDQGKQADPRSGSSSHSIRSSKVTQPTIVPGKSMTRRS